jgi:hypothetical protein
MNIITYIIIGTLFTFIVDVSSSWVNAKPFNTLERLICIAIWPLTIFVFISAVIKELFKK